VADRRAQASSEWSMVREAVNVCVGVDASPKGHRAVSRQSDVGFFIPKCDAGAIRRHANVFYPGRLPAIQSEVSALGLLGTIIAGLCRSPACRDRPALLLCRGAVFRRPGREAARVRRRSCGCAADSAWSTRPGMCPRMLDADVPACTLHASTVTGDEPRYIRPWRLAERGS